MTHPQTIAIDGPVAAGKTVVGRCLAQRLGYRFLDTGSMYRAATYAALRGGADFSDAESLEALVQGLDIRLEGETGERVLVNGQDVADDLRTPEVEGSVSLLARVPGVRRVLVAKQRELAAELPSVVVGRDIGTHVLPDARLKVFLAASVEVRAGRRCRELEEKGVPRPYQQVLGDLQRRDELDTQRSTNPLRPADDARWVDTDGLTIKEVIERILRLGRNGDS